MKLINESLATDSVGAPMELERPVASWSESDNAWLVSGSVTIHTGRDQPIAFFATRAYLSAEEVPDVTAADFSGELFAANGTASQYSSLPARVYAVSENGARGALGCSD
ncbi:hypothetical protein ACL9RL_07405 [Plantibacter sp. Mn2098]|uniref:hypothetical protein n=1 Tax=Plantibacter sp. Mn2098 TaxID=3395266 RepID=UPI003BCD517C